MPLPVILKQNHIAEGDNSHSLWELRKLRRNLRREGRCPSPTENFVKFFTPSPMSIRGNVYGQTEKQRL